MLFVFVSKLYTSEWVVAGCGGILTKPHDHLTSPGYPGVYPDSVECRWEIRAELGSSIELNIADFYLEGGEDCSYDYLAVYGGPELSSPQLIKMCNRNSQNTTVTSQGSNMLVVFRWVCDSNVLYPLLKVNLF